MVFPNTITINHHPRELVRILCVCISERFSIHMLHTLYTLYCNVRSFATFCKRGLGLFKQMDSLPLTHTALRYLNMKIKTGKRGEVYSFEDFVLTSV